MCDLNFMVARASIRLITLLSIAMISPAALAVDGTWNVQSGDYMTSTNWASNQIANGVGATANFNSVDLMGDASVTLNVDRTLGHMIIGDTNLGLGSEGTWEFRTDNVTIPTLTLDAGGGSPTITVNQLAPTTFDDAFIAYRLNGTAGLTKNGVGILTLSGAGGTLAGPINVNGGTLRLLTPYTNTGTTAYNLATNTRLQSNVSIPTVTVASGASATVNMTATGSISNATAPGGGTLNVEIGTPTASATLDVAANWTGSGTVNFTGLNPGGNSFIRLQPNPNGTSGLTAFNNASFAATAVHLDNVQVRARSNSQGNSVDIGKLTGTSTAQLAGGNAGPGTSGAGVRYIVGNLNQDSTYSGSINGLGGVSLNKVGTAKLTLAGTFIGDPLNNSLATDNADPDRQAGVIRVTAGTLALTGAASIPAGFGARLTTIDVLGGATLDVTATPGTFSTSNLQKLQGSGTILGTYNHDEGFIRPADVGRATDANEGNLSAGIVATAGTINFNGNLQLNGGTIVYDMSPTPGSGNDLVSVTGTTALNSGKISPNFLGAIPTSGTYTVLTSSGGFTGSASNITVDFPGRGADPIPSISGNSLVFSPASVGAAADLVWRGNHGTNPSFWDVETTQNWLNGASPDVFYNLDSVTFDDTAVGTTVDVRSQVQPVATLAKPVAVTINNPTKNYTFTGTGGITGNAALTKTGAGTLVMQVNNSFTGPASVTSSVDIGGFSTALGTGALTLNNATILGTATLANSSVDVPAGSVSEISANGGTAGAAAFFNVPTLTGDGELTLSSTVNDKAFGMGVTAGFTGTLNIEPAAPATVLNAVRIRGGQTNLANAVVNITGARISNQQGGAIGSTVNLEIGELHGTADTSLNAFEGGAADKPHANWQIGALNTNSDFAGAIVDGAAPAISHVTKVGTGSLTLTGANTYTGDTRVQGGTLSISQINPATAGDVYLTMGSILNLTFSGIDQIDSLFIDSSPKNIGKWGRIGSIAAFGANFETPLITGDGLLEVLTLGVSPALTGDFNDDGFVDAADYTVWRNNLNALTDDPILNRGDGVAGINEADYNIWKANYGNTLPGAGGGGLSSAVPEPTSCVLALMALAAIFGCRRVR